MMQSNNAGDTFDCADQFFSPKEDDLASRPVTQNISHKNLAGRMSDMRQYPREEGM